MDRESCGFVGVGVGDTHVPHKTEYYRILCTCGLIFVVRLPSNLEMGVEVQQNLQIHRPKGNRIDNVCTSLFINIEYTRIRQQYKLQKG